LFTLIEHDSQLSLCCMAVYFTTCVESFTHMPLKKLPVTYTT
jgi:hypothetical protein